MKKYGNYYVTIGLEIHLALKTQTKLFSRSENNFISDDFALFDAGTPGVLPILSDLPVKMAVAFALSTNALVEKYSEFERKHYFYPDLPLGYQITQQHNPIMIGGVVPIKIDNVEKMIQIEHAHLECDAAKSLHDKFNNFTAIDLSRCASPLLEIVSTPCMHSPEEAKEYAKKVHALAMFLDICDGKMQEGSFRVDASISLHKEIGKLGTRVENKNISSFSFLEDALNYEIQRQSELLDKNELVIMETRLFDELSMTTKSMRLKETVDEYRFMYDPDIPPLSLNELFIDEVKNNFCIDYFLISKNIEAILKQYQLNDIYIYQILSGSYKNIWIDIALNKINHSEKLIRLLGYWLPEVLAKVSTEKTLTINEINILVNSVLESKEIKETIIKWLDSDLSILDCMPVFISEKELEEIIVLLLKDFSEQVEKYKKGELKIAQFLIGKVIVKVKGKYPASLIKDKVHHFLLNNDK